MILVSSSSKLQNLVTLASSRGASTSSNGNSRNPAGTGDTDYSGNVGKGASGAELDGHTGKVVLRY